MCYVYPGGMTMVGEIKGNLIEEVLLNLYNMAGL